MVLSQDWSGKLFGDYRLLRRLGSGSFGDVYQAEDLREQSQVAIKLIKAPLTQHEDLKAFLNEARSIRLRHPHIVPLLDFGLSEQDLPFLVMEYVAGGTLRDRYPKGSRIPLNNVADVIMQLASALQYAHDQHLLHRDIKPENMLCRSDGTILLSDFGIASVAHASGSVSAYQVFGGTLPYMAPEQHMGKPRPASDQYALAVVGYEWLTGARLFQGTAPEIALQHLSAPPPSLVKQLPTLPIAVEQVFFKALSKNPQDRFIRVYDFAIALRNASQPPMVSPSPASHPMAWLLDGKQPVPDPINTGQATRNLPLFSSLPPAPGSGIGVNQPLSAPLAIPSVASTTHLHGGPGNNVLPSPAQHRKIFNRRVLFIFSLMLLVVLSSSGLFYFVLEKPRTATLTPSQATTATAAAAAQSYATGTAKQGVMFGFDAAHTRNNPYERILNSHNISQLTPLWTFVTKDSIRPSPTVAGGMVYVGSYDGEFYAFDATCRKNCQPLWNSSIGNLINSSPAIAGGMVYVSSNNYNFTNGKLYAFDVTCRRDCQPLWNFSTRNTNDSSPTVVGGIVYISVYSLSISFPRMGKLYAFGLIG